MSGARARGRRSRPVKDPALLQRAVGAHGEGRLDEAERAYKKFLKRNPGQPVALHNLGLLLHGSGQPAEAVRLLEQAAKSGEGDASLYSNLGNMLREQGRLDAAVTALRTAVELDPKHLNARYNLGSVLQDTGALDEAISVYRALLSVGADDAGVLNNLGSALLANGDVTGAIGVLERAIAIEPRYARALLNLAAARTTAGEQPAAEVALRAAVQFEPGLADAQIALGALELSQDRLAEAEQHAREAARLDPENARAHVLCGRVASRRGQAEAAVAAFERSVAIDAQNVEAWCELGTALAARGRIAKALSAIERARALEPFSGRVLYMSGLAAMIQGDTEGAKAALEAAAEHMPDSPALWFNLSKTRRFTTDDDALIVRLETIPDRRALGGEALAQLHFALGKMRDDRKEAGQAFEHFARGNALVRARTSFDPGAIPRSAQASARVFTKQYFDNARAFGDETERPVFIFGMPRSGTTLVEQILASHPQVHGAGELTRLPELAESLGGGGGEGGRYPESALTLDYETARALRRSYLERLNECSDEALRVSDKLPGNYRYLGLIATLFPRAKLIHCTRDPMDVCWSNYTQLFADGMQYTYSLEDLGRTYRAYEALMAHWRRVLPVPMCEVQYETLTAEPERVSRELVAYCDLEWDARCLEFHEHARPVNTASNWQIRQPVYRTAVARWKPYEPWLGELKAALGLR